ncbi:TIGR03943 family protein [Nocardia terpenica]|nr:TIGR03943 family protein [Nocardia terpenica]MBF6108767.1 TIGR03943 family protein [Nocardia terpenica]MBF6114047.1 TIGR03943 family protein [Nocardia terpenica]MBF6120329.1 TIGR03943 family protein [Nocardia terpenica]MBF6156360.1 TIGR03943 family protein [Nocardia terpenica]
MNRVAQNFVLLLIGGAVLKIAVDGTFLRYVKPGLQPYLIASGVVLLALTLVAIGRDIRRGWAAADSDHHPGRPQWLLLAPIAALLIIVPPALGATSVQSGTTARASVAKPATAGDDGTFAFPPLPEGPAPTIRMYDLLDRAAYDSSGELDHRAVTVVGFIVHTDNDGSPRTDGTRSGVDLARVVITCCVADAQTMRIHLSALADPPPDDTWVSVSGKVEPGSARPDTEMTPTLDVTEMHVVPTPARVYG